MRILIISDSHGDTDNFDEILRKEAPFDMVIHCGDGARDIDYMEARSKCTVMDVRGNCDLLTKAPANLITTIGNYRAYVEHGVHLSTMTASSLVEFAHFNKVDILMYGHTHHQRIENHDGIWIINPGSISKPRDGAPSYIVLSLDQNGELYFDGKRLY